MTCASCVSLIENESSKIKGINKVSVNFATEKISLDHNQEFNEEAYISFISTLGYRLVDENHTAVSAQSNSLVVACLYIVMGLIFMLLMSENIMRYFNHELINLFQIIVASVMMLYHLNFYLKNIWNFLTKFISNMHTLIGIGLLTNWFYSIFQFSTNHHAHLFVEAIPFILGFTKLGKFFDHLAKTKALASMSSLYKTQIKFANKLVDNKTFPTPVIELKINDVIRIRPGEKIPLNGVVITGNSHTDEALISGESIPVHKAMNDEVHSGSINIEGTLDIKITNEFNESSIAKIIELIEQGGMKKTKLEEISNRMVKFFVPSVLLFALFTFIYWFISMHDLTFAVKHTIGVLVIACPCALGLAAPLGAMISTKKLGGKGILISGADQFEKAQAIDTIIFDKTGTLTMGNPEVVDLLTSDQKRESLSLLYSSCLNSNHPLSKAIVNFLKPENLEIRDPDKFKNVPGEGFISSFNDVEIIVGNEKIFNSHHISISANLISKKVGSVVYVSIGKKHCFTFIVADKLRSTSKELINKLKQMGIEVWMITGDNEASALDMARELEIEKIVFKASPIEKKEKLIELKKRGQKVAMIGDGINDSVALSYSDLSIAMNNGSDIAIATSDVTVSDDHFENLYSFFEISKKTVRIIKENLFLSIVYNAFCIPLAGGFLYNSFKLDLNPSWAALAMGLSSMSVIINSVRLMRE